MRCYIIYTLLFTSAGNHADIVADAARLYGGSTMAATIRHSGRAWHTKQVELLESCVLSQQSTNLSFLRRNISKDPVETEAYLLDRREFLQLSVTTLDWIIKDIHNEKV